MGMAASQARFLGLAARKTNVEYEGQQINQARVALANQSAATFNEMLGMSVPTAPDKTKFAKLQYSYTDGTYGMAISDLAQLINDPEGYNYTATKYYMAEMYEGIESKRTHPQVVMTEMRDAESFMVPSGSITTDPKKPGLYFKDSINDPAVKTSYSQYNPTNPTHRNEWERILEQYSDQYPGLKSIPPEDLRVMRDPDDGLYKFTTVQALRAAASSGSTVSNAEGLNNQMMVSQQGQITGYAYAAHDALSHARDTVYNDYVVGTGTAGDPTTYTGIFADSPSILALVENGGDIQTLLTNALIGIDSAANQFPPTFEGLSGAEEQARTLANYSDILQATLQAELNKIAQQQSAAQSDYDAAQNLANSLGSEFGVANSGLSAAQQALADAQAAEIAAYTGLYGGTAAYGANGLEAQFGPNSTDPAIASLFFVDGDTTKGLIPISELDPAVHGAAVGPGKVADLFAAEAAYTSAIDGSQYEQELEKLYGMVDDGEGNPVVGNPNNYAPGSIEANYQTAKAALDAALRSGDPANPGLAEIQAQIDAMSPIYNYYKQTEEAKYNALYGAGVDENGQRLYGPDNVAWDGYEPAAPTSAQGQLNAALAADATASANLTAAQASYTNAVNSLPTLQGAYNGQYNSIYGTGTPTLPDPASPWGQYVDAVDAYSIANGAIGPTSPVVAAYNQANAALSGPKGALDGAYAAERVAVNGVLPGAYVDGTVLAFDTALQTFKDANPADHAAYYTAKNALITEANAIASGGDDAATYATNILNALNSADETAAENAVYGAGGNPTAPEAGSLMSLFNAAQTNLTTAQNANNAALTARNNAYTSLYGVAYTGTTVGMPPAPTAAQLADPANTSPMGVLTKNQNALTAGINDARAQHNTLYGGPTYGPPIADPANPTGALLVPGNADPNAYGPSSLFAAAANANTALGVNDGIPSADTVYGRYNIATAEYTAAEEALGDVADPASLAGSYAALADAKELKQEEIGQLWANLYGNGIYDADTHGLYGDASWNYPWGPENPWGHGPTADPDDPSAVSPAGQRQEALNAIAAADSSDVMAQLIADMEAATAAAEAASIAVQDAASAADVRAAELDVQEIKYGLDTNADGNVTLADVDISGNGVFDIGDLWDNSTAPPTLNPNVEIGPDGKYVAKLGDNNLPTAAGAYLAALGNFGSPTDSAAAQAAAGMPLSASGVLNDLNAQAAAVNDAIADIRDDINATKTAAANATEAMSKVYTTESALDLANNAAKIAQAEAILMTNPTIELEAAIKAAKENPLDDNLANIALAESIYAQEPTNEHYQQLLAAKYEAQEAKSAADSNYYNSNEALTALQKLLDIAAEPDGMDTLAAMVYDAGATPPRTLADAYTAYNTAMGGSPTIAEQTAARAALLEAINSYSQTPAGIAGGEFTEEMSALRGTTAFVAKTEADRVFLEISRQVEEAERLNVNMPALRAALDAAIQEIVAKGPNAKALTDAALAIAIQANGGDINGDGELNAEDLYGNGYLEFFVPPSVPVSVGNCPVVPLDLNDPEQKAAIEQIIKDFPESEFAKSYQRGLDAGETTIYSWFDPQVGKTYYACIEDLSASANAPLDPDHPSENQVRLTQYNATSNKRKIESVQKAFVDFNDMGRAETIRFEDSSQVFTLHTETVIDELAYNAAMNQYTYDVKMYENKIEEINAKTKIIQEQDRTLELRLRQLDTEQDALQTEMEAVKKVIEKNVESTFKTFE